MAVDQGRPGTSLAKYVGGVLEAMGEFITDTRECVEGFLENSDSMQRRARRTARRALRPGTEGDPGEAGADRPGVGELASLRAEIAALTARLSRFETASDAADPA